MPPSPTVPEQLARARSLPYAGTNVNPAALSSLGSPTDPVAHVALVLGLLLVAARLAGEGAARLGQPQVLGELVAGIVLSALPGVSFFRDLGSDPSVDMLARLGAIVLLFDAGLALSVRDVLRAGGAAARVAVIGTTGSLALGWAVTGLLLPHEAPVTRAFLSAALASTSVGISARVLKDLGRTNSVEGRVVLSAAVIDDVLGLVVLSFVTGWGAPPERIPTGGMASLVLIGKTALFFVGAVVLGSVVAPQMLRVAARIKTRSALVVAGLAFCFFLAWAADAVGLAAIIGAFTAGLVLEEAQWSEFVNRGERGLD